MKKRNIVLTTSPRWSVLLLGVVITWWSVFSYCMDLESSYSKYKHLEPGMFIVGMVLIVVSGISYKISNISISIRFFGVTVKRIFWSNIGAVVILPIKKDNDKTCILFVPNYLDIGIISAMSTEDLQNSKWKNCVSITFPRDQLNDFSGLANQCGKEVIIR